MSYPEKGIGPFPHGSAVHMAVFTTLESYTGETTLEQGMLELVEEVKALRKAMAETARKECPVCDGWGSVSTGIDEAPSTLCKACDGNGSLPR